MSETIESIEAKDNAVVRSEENAVVAAIRPNDEKIQTRRAVLHYVFLPLLLLFVVLLGGIRFSGRDSSIMFLPPALICLFFGAALVVLFLRARLIEIQGWLSERFSLAENIANVITLAALFLASVQMFNSLLPEQGLPFWIVSFCVFWTLWNNLFAELNSLKLLRSLTAMFVLAFAVKYLLLANLAKPGSEGWVSSLFNNPAQAAATWLLDLPQFAAATGYLQFFTLAIYVIALYFIPPVTED